MEIQVEKSIPAPQPPTTYSLHLDGLSFEELNVIYTIFGNIAGSGGHSNEGTPRELCDLIGERLTDVGCFFTHRSSVPHHGCKGTLDLGQTFEPYKLENLKA